MFGIDKDKIKAAFDAFESRRQEIESSPWVSPFDPGKLRAQLENIEKFIDSLRAAFS